ncbi:MAG: hypothetical protein R3E91_04865 [Chlamydiales bacterium]
MKKIVALLTSLTFAINVQALPIGNPLEASLITEGLFRESHQSSSRLSWLDTWSLRMGFYGDYIYNHYMVIIDAHQQPHSVHKTQILTNAAYFALNLKNYFDLFATLGTSNIEILGGYASLTILSNTSFSWSLGLRKTLWENRDFGLGIEAQYASTKPQSHQPIGSTTLLYADNNYLDYKEWQIGIGGAYRIDMTFGTALIPYLGLKSGQTWIFPHYIGYHLKNLSTGWNFGYAVGITLLGSHRGTLTAEVAFLNEKALYLNGQCRF